MNVPPQPFKRQNLAPDKGLRPAWIGVDQIGDLQQRLRSTQRLFGHHGHRIVNALRGCKVFDWSHICLGGPRRQSGCIMAHGPMRGRIAPHRRLLLCPRLSKPQVSHNLSVRGRPVSGSGGPDVSGVSDGGYSWRCHCCHFFLCHGADSDGCLADVLCVGCDLYDCAGNGRAKTTQRSPSGLICIVSGFSPIIRCSLTFAL